jgi:hypothetical protein
MDRLNDFDFDAGEQLNDEDNAILQGRKAPYHRL